MTNQEKKKRFEEIYLKTYRNLIRYIVCHSRDIEDVNDVLQETYLEFYLIWERKSVKEERLSAFLKGIAKNKIKKHYGRFYKIKTYSLFSKNEREIEWIDTISDDFDTLDFVMNEELAKQIWKYVKTKKEKAIKIFYLYYNEEFTIKEIAQELNLKESSVKSILYRTLKELQETFREEKKKYE